MICTVGYLASFVILSVTVIIIILMIKIKKFHNHNTVTINIPTYALMRNTINVEACQSQMKQVNKCMCACMLRLVDQIYTLPTVG